MSSFFIELYKSTKADNLPPNSLLYRLKKKLAKARRYVRFWLNGADNNRNLQIKVIDNNPPIQEDLSRILLLKLDQIGDFFTALQAFKLIRDGFSNAHITFVCLPLVKPLAVSTGLFNEVISFEPKADFDNNASIKAQVTITIDNFKRTITDAYWLAIDFRHDFDTRKYLDCITAQHKAGFLAKDKDSGETKLSISLPHMEWDVGSNDLNNSSNPLNNALRLKLLATAVLDILNPQTSPPPYLAAFLPTASAKPEKLPVKTKKIRIGLSIGAGAELKTWPNAYWAQLLQSLVKAKSVEFTFFGGSNEKLSSLDLMAQLPADSYIDLVTKLSLEETPAYIANLDYYIGCDTGLTHLAAGLGIPTISLFSGVSSIPVWQASGPYVRTLYVTVPCSPCHLSIRSDCINHHACMNFLTPKTVLENFLEIDA